MSEKVRFYNMTKPVKFRTLKMLKMSIVLWCKALRERIIYLFNYILYKLNILKRYSYRDNVEKVVPLPHPISPQGVSSMNFGGIVVPNLLVEKHIDVDYFYKEKNGVKKITLYLKNVEESRIFLDTHLENIFLIVGGVKYDIHKLPVFKVSYIDPEYLKPTSIEESVEFNKVEYKVTNFDTSKLVNLKHRSLIGVCDNTEDISPRVLKYYYETSVTAFHNCLNNIELSDLII